MTAVKQYAGSVLEQIVKQPGKLGDVFPTTIAIEATGDMEKLNGLLLLLHPCGVLELARISLNNELFLKPGWFWESP
jgi:acetolactate synthase small subunit